MLSWFARASSPSVPEPPRVMAEHRVMPAWAALAVLWSRGWSCLSLSPALINLAVLSYMECICLRL